MGNETFVMPKGINTDLLSRMDCDAGVTHVLCGAYAACDFKCNKIVKSLEHRGGIFCLHSQHWTSSWPSYKAKEKSLPWR